MELKLNVPDVLYKRIEKKSIVLGLTPDLTATFLLALNLHEEEPAPEPPRIFSMRDFVRPQQPESTPEEKQEEKQDR